MKNIVFSFIILTTCLITTKNIFAQANKQHTWSVSFGPEIVAPERRFWETHKIGLGGTAKGEYTFGKHSSVTINTGLLVFDGKIKPDDFTVTNPGSYNKLVAIPLKVGTRYYIGNFYFLGEAGAMFLNNYSNSTRASFSAGLGDKIRIGRQKLDISLRQEIWLGNSNNEQLNMAGLRIAYEIQWKK